MSKLRQTRYFHVTAEHAEAPHDELAAEAVEHAKGGHHVALTLPSGAVVDVHPGDDHHAVTQKIGEALPSKDAISSSASRRKGSATDA